MPKIKEYSCDYNDGIHCEKKNCEECGFYPEVKSKRRKMIHSSMFMNWVIDIKKFMKIKRQV